MRLGGRPIYPILRPMEDLSKHPRFALLIQPVMDDDDGVDFVSHCEVPLFSVSYLVMQLSLKFHSKIRLQSWSLSNQRNEFDCQGLTFQYQWALCCLEPSVLTFAEAQSSYLLCSPTKRSNLTWPHSVCCYPFNASIPRLLMEVAQVLLTQRHCR